MARIHQRDFFNRRGRGEAQSVVDKNYYIFTNLPLRYYFSAQYARWNVFGAGNSAGAI